MKKICILTTTHSPYDGRIYYREALSLNKTGCEIIIVAPHEKNEKCDGIEIKPIKPYSNKLSRVKNLFKIYKLAKLLKADIYHFHDPDFIFFGFCLQKVSKKPVIYDMHENYPLAFKSRPNIHPFLKPFLSFGFDQIEKFISKRFNGIIGVYEDRLEEVSHNHQHKLFLPNYPSTSIFRKVDLRKKEFKRMIYVGGMSKERGEDIIIETMFKLKNVGSDLYLDIYGWFDNKDKEVKFISELKAKRIDNVNYKGRVPYHKLPEAIETATIGLIPWLPTVQHLNAANPNKVFEYMASSIICVAPRFGMFKKLFENSDLGFLFSPGDSETFLTALLWIEQI